MPSTDDEGPLTDDEVALTDDERPIRCVRLSAIEADSFHFCFLALTCTIYKYLPDDNAVFIPH